MKYHKEDRRMTSDGKVLMITPIIRDPYGVPYMLPPMRYHVPNWLMGYIDEHVLGYPITLLTNPPMRVPGSSSAMDVQISFTASIEEAWPDSVLPEANIGPEQVERLLHGLVEYRRLIDGGREEGTDDGGIQPL